jgi:CHAT domain-containing protein
VSGRTEQTLRGRGWEPLEASLDEARDIQEALRGTPWEPAAPFTGPAALEERLKGLRSPRLLHVATHGFYFERSARGGPEGTGVEGRIVGSDNPLLRSGLVLAGADRWREQLPEGVRLEDDWLTAEEVASLDLQGTELVVLSACESGLGDVKAGEGVYGLRRAFLYAGAHTLVTSLFRVPDRQTRPLMRDFYRNLAAGKGKLDALTAAQRAFLEDRRKTNDGTAHPFYWASFILVGDPGLLPGK